MIIGVLSDIHDNICNLDKAIDIFNRKKVKNVFFCGDLTSCFTIDYFRRLIAPVKAVFGNNEGDRIGILNRVESNKLKFDYAPKQGLMWDFILEGKRIGIYHGNQQEILDNIIKAKQYDLLCTGHNHIVAVNRIGKMLWVNPGSVCGRAGLDIKPIPSTCATVDLNKTEAVIHQL